MALFTDGTVSTIEELLDYEGALLDVARTERIDLAVKLRLAQQEIGIELTAFLAERGGGGWQGWLGGRPGLGNIVVTEPLKKWHLFHSLALVYRDAYNSQLNDRYQGKWKEYDRLSKWASGALFRIGVGTVSDPVPQADRPVLSSVAGPQPEATYYVRVAWLNVAGEEGYASELAALSVPAGSLLVVQAMNAPANARSWNVYAGTAAEDVTLQNQAPLAVGEAWTEPPSGMVRGRAPGTGQAPQSYLRASGAFLGG